MKQEKIDENKIKLVTKYNTTFYQNKTIDNLKSILKLFRCWH